ncbi:hypothetical protein CEXT_381251 [Caerostris extrusa]|uniref:Uncharacterized protein n=1 Tax=Caerostris extrusa TaxID=172846 RepID=A0AAV4XRS9_CAEEX|nr:hypothetical protein CEXT_381251 [Caerostris extrusa]
MKSFSYLFKILHFHPQISLFRQSALTNRKETHTISHSIGSLRGDVIRIHISQGRRLLIATIALANCCYSWAKTNIILGCIDRWGSKVSRGWFEVMAFSSH